MSMTSYRSAYLRSYGWNSGPSGSEFSSDTDTEVIAHLIDKHLKQGRDFEASLREAQGQTSEQNKEAIQLRALQREAAAKHLAEAIAAYRTLVELQPERPVALLGLAWWLLGLLVFVVGLVRLATAG